MRATAAYVSASSESRRLRSAVARASSFQWYLFLARTPCLDSHPSLPIDLRAESSLNLLDLLDPALVRD